MMESINSFRYWLEAGGFRIKSIILLVLSVIFLAACQSATQIPDFPPTQALVTPTEKTVEIQLVTPSVKIEDQPINDDEVTVSEVISDGPGWLVIHAQADGKPGLILGYSQVEDGVNEGITVVINKAEATETLYAMLHIDAGQIGVWEFPDGPDVPTKVGDKVVAPPFKNLETIKVNSPSVTVEDQSIENSTVRIAEVVSDGPGWLVVHSQVDGKPGPIVGYSPVQDGVNNGIVIEIEEVDATENLYAMLHVDAGEVGEWEFPEGSDTPVKVNEVVVAPAFKVVKSSQAEADIAVDPVILLGGNEELGAFLTDVDGKTLYTFSNDQDGETNCYDVCAQNWPPLLIDEGESLAGGEGLDGDLGTIARSNGTSQVTYNGSPLYYWIKDVDVGDSTGHGVNRAWAVARAQTPTVLLGGNSKLGRFLTGSNGMTLYIFAQDWPGQSNCIEQCAANWPPLLLQNGAELTGGAGVIGKLGTIERTDGGLQVTYNGMPLYFWIEDSIPGDANGHGFNKVWIVANQWASLTSFDTGGGGGGGGDRGSGY